VSFLGDLGADADPANSEHVRTQDSDGILSEEVAQDLRVGDFVACPDAEPRLTLQESRVHNPTKSKGIFKPGDVEVLPTAHGPLGFLNTPERPPPVNDYLDIRSTQVSQQLDAATQLTGICIRGSFYLESAETLLHARCEALGEFLIRLSIDVIALDHEHW
jgi:hypothetical protein